jgi:hypothetical protein
MMIEAKESEILNLVVVSVVVEMRNLPLLNGLVAIQAKTDTATAPALNEDFCLA